MEFHLFCFIKFTNVDTDEEQTTENKVKRSDAESDESVRAALETAEQIISLNYDTEAAINDLNLLRQLNKEIAEKNRI
jgi:hypothetical protein